VVASGLLWGLIVVSQVHPTDLLEGLAGYCLGAAIGAVLTAITEHIRWQELEEPSVS